MSAEILMLIVQLCRYQGATAKIEVACQKETIACMDKERQDGSVSDEQNIERCIRKRQPPK